MDRLQGHRGTCGLANSIPHSARNNHLIHSERPVKLSLDTPPPPSSLAQRRSHKTPWSSFLLHFQVPGCLACARSGLRTCFAKEVGQDLQSVMVLLFWSFLRRPRTPSVLSSLTSSGQRAGPRSWPPGPACCADEGLHKHLRVSSGPPGKCFPEEVEVQRSPHRGSG